MQSPIDFSPLAGFPKFLSPTITNIKYFFKKEFISERYILHFFLSMPFVLPFILLNINKIEWWGLLLLSYFGAYTINWCREAYYEKFHEAPFSYVDVIFGGYGGFTIALISLIVNYLIN